MEIKKLYINPRKAGIESLFSYQTIFMPDDNRYYKFYRFLWAGEFQRG